MKMNYKKFNKHRREPSEIISNALPLSRLFPNFITLVALCLGLTSIRYGLDHKWEHSIALLIIAAFLDAMDGRIARYLKVTSDFGAHLDSLADFFNFGIAPAIIIYMWTLNDIATKGVGWGVVLVFSACCAIRLARFNVASNDESSKKLREMFFTGVNAPAGAMLIVTPMILSFEFEEYASVIKTPWIIAITMLVVAFAMVSRIPTFAMKKFSISHRNVTIVLGLFGFIVAALMIKPWLTISFLSLIYILSIPISVAFYYKNFHNKSN